MPGAWAKRRTMENSTPVATATKAINLISEGKNNTLKNYVPEGQSPKVYIELIKSQVMGVDKMGKPRPDEDLLMFLYTCQRTGLDPLTHQIFAVYRWDSRIGAEKMSIQTGIDGMRLVAQRSRQYAGQDDVIYTPEDESLPHPTKATVTVYKMIKGQRVNFTASARWSEYCPLGKDRKPMGMWLKMPYLMLGKCAEALALRKAFPNELSGVYSSEEMAQSSPTADLPAPNKLADRPEIKVSKTAADVRKQLKKVEPIYEEMTPERLELVEDEANNFHNQDGKN